MDRFNRIRLFIPLFGLALLTQSCQKDGNFEDQLLHDQLTAALINASDGAGINHFKLPDGNNLSKIPQDPKNPLNPAKIELGSLLYHETGMAVNPKHNNGTGTYSCASCHSAQAGFQAGKRQGIGDGGTGYGSRGEGRDIAAGYAIADIDVQPIRSPSTLNTAFQEVMLWNGQFGATGINAGTEAQWTANSPKETNLLGYEGLETQAIAGVGVHRMACEEDMIKAVGYDALFDRAFPDEPIATRYSGENGGLAIAAYERTLLANRAPFQRWLGGELGAMTEKQKKGAVLFFDRAQCYSCHNGPALNSMDFHALGMGDFDGTGTYGDADEPTNKGRGGFTGNPADDFKFKVPQLYNLTDSPFYGHGGTFTSISEVIGYKNKAQPQKPIPNPDPSFAPLELTAMEVSQLTAFVGEALHDPELERYVPEALLSGLCFPNNDAISRTDLGCD